jgi:hypothetical protein
MKALEELNRTILLCRDYVVDELSNEEICQCFQSLRILCVSDLDNLLSHSGQTALVTLVCLLSRMGMQVGLAVPNVAMLSPQPPLSGTSLRDALNSTSGALLSGATICCDSDFRPDIIFALGDTLIDSTRTPSWRLTGNDWYGALAREGEEKTHAWTAEWPVGSMVSAALAASEAFKFAIRRLRFRRQTDLIFFEPSRSCGWGFDPAPIPERSVSIGNVDLISAGAISQAALYALMRFPNVHMLGRIFDDDLTGVSNLNRNMLTLICDLDSPKVRVVAGRCGAKLRLEPVTERFVGRSSRVDLAHRVLVGVDDVPSRWEVQRNAPGWVAVSGTSHFSVSSSEHGPHQPCCGCLHPVDDVGGANPIPTVSFVSFWAGLGMAVRLLREAIGSPYPSSKQHLWLTPLRMDERHAAMWFPVAPHRNCPVRCSDSRALQ